MFVCYFVEIVAFASPSLTCRFCFPLKFYASACGARRRDAVRKLVVESEVGSLAEKTEKTSVELVKEVREKIWRQCLKETGGDREKALRTLERKIEGSE